METLTILENREWCCCWLNEFGNPIQVVFLPSTFGECTSFCRGFNLGNSNPAFVMHVSQVPARLLQPITSLVKQVA